MIECEIECPKATPAVFVEEGRNAGGTLRWGGEDVPAGGNHDSSIDHYVIPACAVH